VKSGARRAVDPLAQNFVAMGRECSRKSPDERALIELDIYDPQSPYTPTERAIAEKLLRWHPEPWAESSQ